MNIQILKRKTMIDRMKDCKRTFMANIFALVVFIIFKNTRN